MWRFLSLLALTCGLLAGCSKSPEEQALLIIENAGGRLRSDADGRVISADFTGTQAGDLAVAALAAFPHLQTINASGASRITGSGFAALAGLPSLDSVYLAETALDDAGLAALSRIKSLTTLQIGHTKITDRGMDSLDHLTNLRTLSLAGTAVTDRGLVQLRDLRNLSTLNVRDTQTTRAGIQELRRMLPEARVVD